MTTSSLNSLFYSPRSFSLLAVFCLSLLSAHAQTAAPSPAIPDGSAMGSSKPDLQRLMLNPLCDRASINFPIKDKVFAAVEDYVGVDPKVGSMALKLQDLVKKEGELQDFIIAFPPSNPIEQIGLWIYLAPDSNVEQVGLQIIDKEDEVLSNTVPADWQGWKWVEFNLQSGFKQVSKQDGKNSQVDSPLKQIHLVWTSKGGGVTSLGVNGLAAIAQSVPTNDAFSFDVLNPTEGYPAAPYRGKLLIQNFTDKPIDFDIAYSVQRNPQLYDKKLIDPVLGPNRALGQKNWMEIDGKKIDDNSLTDGDDETSYTAPWGNNNKNYAEGFQFLDLGQEQKIIRIDYHSGDSNWIHKIDFASSTDGTNYTPIDGLQDVDVYHKYGIQNVPLKQPLNARYLRLRYHNDGTLEPVIRTESELDVYSGVGDEKVEIPKVGDMVEQKSVHVSAAPKTFTFVPMDAAAPWPTGSYYVGVDVKGPAGRKLYASDHFVRSAEDVKMRPESRFGMNGAQAKWIPQLKEIGFGWLRFENMKWGFYNTSPTDFLLKGAAVHSDVPFDDYYQAYHDAGISVVPYIFQTPPWASSAPEGTTKNVGGYPPKDYDDYGKAIFEAVARYGTTKHSPDELHTPDKISGLGLITTYEIWNEPNLNDPGWGFFVAPFEKFLDLLRVGAEAVKRADPNSKVCAAGLSGISLSLVDKYHTYKYPDGKTPLDFIDILNVHFYSGRQEPELATEDPNTNRSGMKVEDIPTYEHELTEVADWRDDLKPNMPLWLTETGNDVGGPIGRTERFQAAKLPRDLMIGLANGVEKIFLYRETGSNAVMHGGAGVIRNDGSLRPSFFTLSTLSRQLDGAMDVRVPRLMTSDPKVWMYRWKRANDYVVTAWTPENTVPLGLDLGKCHVVDAFGAATDMEVTKDFPLTIFPVYITQITNAAVIDGLVNDAVAREKERKRVHAATVKLHAYLYQFGSNAHPGTKTIGTPRPYIPVFAGDVYDAKKGYGWASPDGKDGDAPWTPVPLEKSAIAFTKPDSFQIDAAPGSYTFELKAVKMGNAQLGISGGKEGDISLPFTDDGKVKVTTQITVEEGKPIIVKLPGPIQVQWLTLVENLPPAS